MMNAVTQANNEKQSVYHESFLQFRTLPCVPIDTYFIKLKYIQNSTQTTLMTTSVLFFRKKGAAVNIIWLLT